MKIRSQLVILVLAGIAPVAIFAAITTFELWQVQRRSYEQQLLERVSALRLALDTELEGTIRTLRSLADSADFDPGAGALQAHAHFERLTLRPEWITMGLVDATGDTLVRVDGEGVSASLKFDESTAEFVRSTRTPAISNLVAFDDGRTLVTFVAVPVLRHSVLHGIVYVGVQHRGWLALLNDYPIAEGATLTLNDRTGMIVTRTLHDEQWAGKRSSQAYWERTIGHDEGVFQSVGLEGQRFYSAFSRSRMAGWVIGTGVPRGDFEASLAVPTTLLGLGIATAAVLASLLAWFLGRRVADTVTALAEYAKSMAGPRRPSPSVPLPIVEAETVRVALDETALKLDARERSLNEALEREGRSRAVAEHANESKDQFLAMLGHELRNPLSAISAAVTVLDMATRDADADRRAREIVRRQLTQLTEIVNDLLDVSRLTIGKIALNQRQLDLADIVRQVIASFRDAGRCGHVSIETVLTPAHVIADETRIEQVVGNLLDNACKYTPSGGHVVVSVEAIGDVAELRVRDDGSGIAADLLPHVFEVFAQGQRTIDRAQGGLGLGLTVVRRLVELHGGSVAVESGGANRGSMFVVRIPRGESPSTPERASDTQAAMTTRRIVLVEDNPDSREVVSTLLRMRGHDVAIAVDGPAGLAAIGSGDVDIALVDIGLPGFDGAELARRVRDRSGVRKVILIALTGYGTPEDREAALAAGFDDFLVKPFDLQAFEAAVAGVERLRRGKA